MCLWASGVSAMRSSVMVMDSPGLKARLRGTRGLGGWTVFEMPSGVVGPAPASPSRRRSPVSVVVPETVALRLSLPSSWARGAPPRSHLPLRGAGCEFTSPRRGFNPTHQTGVLGRTLLVPP